MLLPENKNCMRTADNAVQQVMQYCTITIYLQGWVEDAVYIYI